MAFTYSGDPNLSDLDAVRFLIDDTVEANALFQDEELEWLISENEDVYRAAAAAADTLAARFSGSSDSKSADGLSISNNRYDKYKQLAAQLRKMGASRGRLGLPYAGGLSKMERIIDDRNVDLPKGAFRSEIHDADGQDYNDSGIVSSWGRD